MSGPIVIVGDTLLDRDVEGDVARLCPDAPVPVLDEQSASDRPGGAGLAALLAAEPDREVVLVTALAGDAGGARLSELFAAAGVQVYPLSLAGGTPEKVRLRAGGQVLLRLDRGGSGAAVSGEPSEAVRAVIADAAAVLVSDYGRGVARHPTLRTAIAETRAPVVWDPHPRGPAPVAGARLATPNEAEAHQLAGIASRGGNRAAIVTRAAQELRQRWRAGAVAVTMSADGALLCHAGPTPLVVPAPSAVDGDTCGAGDRFAVSATLALAGGALVTESVTAAVAEATGYVARGGVRAALEGPAGSSEPDRSGAAGELVARVRERGGRVVATGGCFDLLHAGHLATLEAARRLGDCLVVCLNSDASVAALKGPARPVVGQADRSRMLAALRCVDAVVVFDEPTPEAVLSWLRPDVWVKGGDYTGSAEDLPEAELVRRWGGQAVVVPYLVGRSTTTLIATAARNGHSRKEPR
jgi:rfaE bifunctional protein nucleotidyltransferase chain/domain/rfaE bifunctional protein kinase chain/domain